MTTLNVEEHWSVVTNNPSISDVSDMTVTATGGSTARTLADWFEYTGREDDDVPKGPFWMDVDPTASPLKLGTRVFVGEAVVQSGTTAFIAPGTMRTWVGLEAAGAMTYFDSRSQMEVISTIGGIAAAFASRASDKTGNSTVPIAIAGFAKNDYLDATPANRVGAWGGYIHVYRDADVGADIAGGVHAFELDVANLGALIVVNPYTPLTSKLGASFNLLVQSGGEISATATLDPVSVGIYLGNNGSKYDKGIVLGAGAIDGTDGTTGIGKAISLAKGHEIGWFYSAGATAYGGAIRSDANDLTIHARLLFLNNGIQIVQTASEVPLVQFLTKASAINGLVFEPGTTGNGFIIRPPTSLGDANYPVILRSKGTSSVALQSGDGTNKVAASNTGIGFFAATPVAKQTVPIAAVDPATTMALVNSLRTALINYGLAV